MPAPHYLILENRQLCLTALVASLLLSLWVVYLDPVINNDGILYVEAAEHFRSGQWGAGLSLYKWPFYSLVIGAASAVTGLAGGHAAYAVNAALYVLLMLGFVALVRSLGAGRTVQWIALLVALAHPGLNEYRAFVIRDIGYWASYLWALAYFFAYLQQRSNRLLTGWIVCSVLAFLFRVEGVLLFTVLPACLYAFECQGRKRALALALVAVITALILSASPLWQYLSELDMTDEALTTNPLEHLFSSWSTRASEVLTRLDALRWELDGITSRLMALAVYVSTSAFIMLYELVRSLGVVFSGLVVYSLVRSIRFARHGLRRWWTIVAGIQVLLVFQFVFANFFLADRYAVALALTLLAVVPFCLERLWRDWQRSDRRLSVGSILLVLLLAVQTVDGLDTATEKGHVKEAGLWLRANAATGSTLYSNSRILVYYSGLRETRGDPSYTWEEAMSELWTDRWQAHDYFALVLSRSDTRHEVQLLKRIDTEPVKRFTNDGGSAVLIFRSR